MCDGCCGNNRMQTLFYIAPIDQVRGELPTILSKEKKKETLEGSLCEEKDFGWEKQNYDFHIYKCRAELGFYLLAFNKQMY